jgi:hypothetical protein
MPCQTYCVLLEAVLTHALHIICSMYIYIYKSLFKISIFAFNCIGNILFIYICVCTIWVFLIELVIANEEKGDDK